MIKKFFYIISAIIVATFIYSLIEPHLLSVTKLTFTSPDLPKSFDGVKIVFTSDWHLDQFESLTRIRKAVNKVNEQKADIVILGGDYINWRLSEIDPVFAELKKIQAPLGVYAVTGNHDDEVYLEKVDQAIEANSFYNLNNQGYWLTRGDGKIKIGGIGDLYYNTQDLDPTTLDTEQKDFVILVSHNPDYAETLFDTHKIDLVLSGHTHGGQVAFFNWAPLTMSQFGNKYRYGWVNLPTTKVFVSRGLGTTILPIRLFNVPEVVVLELKAVNTK